MTTLSSTALSHRLDTVIEEESAAFVARQPQSRAHTQRARHLAGGATSNWQIAEPQAVWISHGVGPKIYDVDGCEYSDFHGGYGVSLAGHAHPAIVEAVRERVARGTHFAQPTEDAIAVADDLARRFGQPLWRFGKSGRARRGRCRRGKPGAVRRPIRSQSGAGRRGRGCAPSRS